MPKASSEITPAISVSRTRIDWGRHRISSPGPRTRETSSRPGLREGGGTLGALVEPSAGGENRADQQVRLVAGEKALVIQPHLTIAPIGAEGSSHRLNDLLFFLDGSHQALRSSRAETTPPATNPAYGQLILRVTATPQTRCGSDHQGRRPARSRIAIPMNEYDRRRTSAGSGHEIRIPGVRHHSSPNRRERSASWSGAQESRSRSATGSLAQ
jgi:hypothetical protein